MAVLTIDGAAAPSPSTLKVSVFEVGSSQARSASGRLVVDCVAVKRRLTLGWAHLTPTELGGLLGAVSGAFFTATYPDPQTMAPRTMICLCSESSMGVLRVQDGAPVWTDVQMEWIEQ